MKLFLFVSFSFSHSRLLTNYIYIYAVNLIWRGNSYIFIVSCICFVTSIYLISTLYYLMWCTTFLRDENQLQHKFKFVMSGTIKARLIERIMTSYNTVNRVKSSSIIRATDGYSHIPMLTWLNVFPTAKTGHITTEMYTGINRAAHSTCMIAHKSFFKPNSFCDIDF